ncbi:hypothetical protein K504DRAFT_367240 [Pleomassaria siparia CBS 279.74]|uniref:Thiamine-binding protein domain-containing protein n=1 Tax=Pleomassaria siparia CBS 279.74 TaxID=1314801 RepID=A0A6G1KND5_9PLEO|nr:hypothetical protein K504DRAFT_367240 [Pleomassaria siparia CBS 279.74]
MPNTDLATLSTPPSCIADFCLIPLGTPTASVSKEVAEVQRILKRSGLEYSMHSAGTTVEGSWDDVMKIIGQCHALLHANGVVRIQSDIRVGSRTDKKQGMQDKVDAVTKLLAQDEDEDEDQGQEQGAKPGKTWSLLKNEDLATPPLEKSSTIGVGEEHPPVGHGHRRGNSIGIAQEH